MVKTRSSYPTAVQVKRAGLGSSFRFNRQSGEHLKASTSPNMAAPLPGSCSFYVEKKRRFCKMVAARGRTFCGEHATMVSSRTRWCVFGPKIMEEEEEEKSRLRAPEVLLTTYIAAVRLQWPPPGGAVVSIDQTCIYIGRPEKKSSPCDVTTSLTAVSFRRQTAAGSRVHWTPNSESAANQSINQHLIEINTVCVCVSVLWVQTNWWSTWRSVTPGGSPHL